MNLEKNFGRHQTAASDEALNDSGLEISDDNASNIGVYIRSFQQLTITRHGLKVVT